MSSTFRPKVYLSGLTRYAGLLGINRRFFATFSLSASAADITAEERALFNVAALASAKELDVTIDGPVVLPHLVQWKYGGFTSPTEMLQHAHRVVELLGVELVQEIEFAPGDQQNYRFELHESGASPISHMGKPRLVIWLVASERWYRLHRQFIFAGHDLTDKEMHRLESVVSASDWCSKNLLPFEEFLRRESAKPHPDGIQGDVLPTLEEVKKRISPGFKGWAACSSDLSTTRHLAQEAKSISACLGWPLYRKEVIRQPDHREFESLPEYGGTTKDLSY